MRLIFCVMLSRKSPLSYFLPYCANPYVALPEGNYKYAVARNKYSHLRRICSANYLMKMTEATIKLLKALLLANS